MSLPWAKSDLVWFWLRSPAFQFELAVRATRARAPLLLPVSRRGLLACAGPVAGGGGGGGGGAGWRLRHTALAGLAGRRGRGGRGRTRGGGAGAARAVEGVSRGGCLLVGGARVRAHTRSKIAPRHDGRHARRRQRHQRGRRAGAVGAAERGRVARSVVVWATWRWLLAAAVPPPLPLQPRVPRRRPSM